jgi:hypothetical protein
MTDEEAERMLQRLESEAQIKGDGVEKEMTMGRERLRRKLLARQKQKMYVSTLKNENIVNCVTIYTSCNYRKNYFY